MDTESQQLFDEILRGDKSSLSPSQVDFLKARASYLNDSDRARFADVLEAKPAKKASKE
jgi:hypothetical protein